METKICTKCSKEFPLEYYYKNGNRLQSECKLCHKKRIKEMYDIKVQKINTYKEQKGCKKCGEKRFYLLDFHHPIQSDKEFNISDKIRDKFENILPEIEKCDVLCANCHREWHYISEHNANANYYVWLGETV